MKSSNVLLLAAVISAAVSFATVRFTGTAATAAHRETSYERVMRTGTLRCGYEYWDSAVTRDPQTNELHGAWVDFMNEIGRNAGLKIEWAEHVGWGDVGAALKSGKIDAMCAGMWQSSEKAKVLSFSIPLAYQSIEAFERADETRFDDHFDRIDSPDTAIMVIDSDTSDFLTRSDFPKARRLSLGQLNGTDSDLYMSLVTKKADIVFDTAGLWRQFDKANPGKVRPVMPRRNLRVFGLSIVVDNDDLRLLQMIDVAVEEIINAGTVDRILKKYAADYPEMYLKTNKPYAE